MSRDEFIKNEIEDVMIETPEIQQKTDRLNEKTSYLRNQFPSQLPLGRIDYDKID